MGWWGYKSPGDATGDAVGSISTILNAKNLGSTTAKGKIQFGNCYNKGYVVAYLDGVEIGRANAHVKKTVTFDFKHGSKLELSEFESGIIHFTAFEVDDCIQGMALGLDAKVRKLT